MTKLLMLILLLCSTGLPQTKFRHAAFLHRSAGGQFYNQAGGVTNIPTEIAAYNSDNSLTGEDTVSMYAVYFPYDYAGVSNEPDDWHSVFDKVNTTDTLYSYLDSAWASDYPIIVLKECFPAADISADGVPSDTTSYDAKNVAVYKWHFRSILAIMETYPQKFFFWWNLLPTLESETTSAFASRANWFSTWMKDTLAAGLDSYGDFPSNVYVFDVFHYLDSSYYLPVSYADGANDPHPNTACSDYLDPIFVNELYDQAIIYETLYNANEVIKQEVLPGN